MKTSILRTIKRNRLLVAITVTLGLALASYTIVSSSQGIGKLSILLDGVQTCFTRVHQSYAAQAMGDTGSTYLNSGFMSTTEECFGETISTMEDQFKKQLGEGLRTLNSLASSVHWFHEKLLQDSVGAKQTMESLSERFEQIEGQSLAVQAGLVNLREAKIERIARVKNIMWLMVALLPVLLMLELVTKRRREVENALIEKDAHFELDDVETLKSATVESIIKKALEQNNLVKCSELFSQYHADILDGKISVFMNKAHSDEAPVTSVQKTTPIGAVHLDGTLTGVVDIMSDKLFTQGIVLDMDVVEDVHVKAHEEGVEQIFYQLINNSVKACSVGTSDQKKIQVSTKQLGATVVVDITDTGPGFSRDFIRSEMGIPVQTSTLGVGLTICKEFMKEFGGQISFDNILDIDNNIIGSRVKLLFRSAEKDLTDDSKRVLTIKSGKKKDILRDMEETL